MRPPFPIRVRIADTQTVRYGHASCPHCHRPVQVIEDEHTRRIVGHWLNPERSQMCPGDEEG